MYAANELAIGCLLSVVGGLLLSTSTLRLELLRIRLLTSNCRGTVTICSGSLPIEAVHQPELRSSRIIGAIF
jgi:hypothetical protein